MRKGGKQIRNLQSAIRHRYRRGLRKLFCSLAMTSDLPSKRRIAAAFSAKANGYRTGAHIQRQILQKLVGVVEGHTRDTDMWLDAGCGAGALTELFGEKRTPPRVINADMALGVLKQHKGSCAVQSDIDALPFVDGAFSGVVAASVLHWLDDLSRGLAEIVRVLKSQGVLVFSVFTTGSFSEILSLRRERGLPVSVRIPSNSEFLTALEAVGMRPNRYQAWSDQYVFATALDTLRYLSATGTSAVTGRRLSRMEIGALCNEYEKRFGVDGGVTLSVNILYGTAFKE
jgi:malonyl-CoA O-methyltransferase